MCKIIRRPNLSALSITYCMLMLSKRCETEDKYKYSSIFCFVGARKWKEASHQLAAIHSLLTSVRNSDEDMGSCSFLKVSLPVN